MRGWMVTVVAALSLASGGALAHKEKRTDPCGCHHQWGLRHCHPQKRTPKCEAPAVKADEAPAPESDKQEVKVRKGRNVPPPVIEL